MWGIPEAQNLENRELLKEIPLCVCPAARLSYRHLLTSHLHRWDTGLVGLGLTQYHHCYVQRPSRSGAKCHQTCSTVLIKNSKNSRLDQLSNKTKYCHGIGSSRYSVQEL